jgi:hypothetical protein
MTRHRKETYETRAIVDACKPLLAGHDPAVQGAVLADLTAMWLAGHMGEDSEELRELLLSGFVELVRKLVPINEERIHETFWKSR